jgi:hypothetical protein
MAMKEPVPWPARPTQEELVVASHAMPIQEGQEVVLATLVGCMRAPG